MLYQIITIAEIKEWLSIDDTSVDDFLELLQISATSIVESFINKFGITRHISSEFQNGAGQNSIMLRQYPVYKIDALYDDPSHDFGSDSLVDPDNYIIDYAIGQLSLVDDKNLFFTDRGNIKIDYWAGLSRFLVVDEQNNYIDVTDDGGTAAIEISPQSSYGNNGYIAEDLATAIQTALNTDTILTATYTVTYDHNTHKFTIAADANFSILWASTGTSDAKNMADLLGFTSNDTGAATYTSDEGVTGIPDDIKLAALQICDLLHDQSKQGHGLQNLKKRVLSSGGGTYEYITEAIPIVAKAILDKYKRIYM